MTFDLHCHSTASDGALSPSAVVARAFLNGATQFALTDHDQLAGLDEARAKADELGLKFINGVEISVSWRDLTVHIVGLNFDPNYAPLIEGLAKMADSRFARAQEMAKQLEEIGISGALEGALLQANGRVDLVSRTHFARFLVQKKKSHNVRAVFMDYLVAGKPGFVEHCWSTMEQAVAWIVGAGGVAVLAHPGRYAHTTPNGEDDLFQDFVAAGGRAVEVVTGSHGKKQFKFYADKALEYQLFVSSGSDFHAQGESKMDVGKVPALPTTVMPVWTLWA